MISTLQTRQFRVCLMNKSQLSTNLNKVFSQVARILLKECRKKAFINIFGQNASKNNKGKRRQGGKTWSFPNSEIPHKTFEQNFENSIVWLENSCFSTSHFWSPPPTHTHTIFSSLPAPRKGKKVSNFSLVFFFPFFLQKCSITVSFYILSEQSIRLERKICSELRSGDFCSSSRHKSGVLGRMKYYVCGGTFSEKLPTDKVFSNSCGNGKILRKLEGE